MNTPMSKQEIGHTQNNAPRAYDLSKPEEHARLLRETLDYMRTSRKHGTDRGGREFAIEAIEQIVSGLPTLLSQVRQKDEALRAAQTALNDWTVSHAPDMCGEASVKEAAERVGKTGTLHYIATVQEQIAAALFLTPQPDPAPADDVTEAWKKMADHLEAILPCCEPGCEGRCKLCPDDVIRSAANLLRQSAIMKADIK